MANHTQQKFGATSARANLISLAKRISGGQVRHSEPVLNDYIEAALIEVALYLGTTPGIPSEVIDAIDEVMHWAEPRHFELPPLPLWQRPVSIFIATLFVVAFFFLPELLTLLR